MANECQLSGYSYDGDDLPIMRGTRGLWDNYPMLKKRLTGFDEFITEDFFKDEPNSFWYVWGDIFKR